MKQILISIKPKYVAKILNGEKTLEIRKSFPKCDLPIDVYIYCTKDKDNLYRHFKGEFLILEEFRKECLWNGKVVAKFTLNKVGNITYIKEFCMFTYCHNTPYKACLTEDELITYLNHKTGYAWHIDNLEIFDMPKDLSEFHRCQLLWNCEPYDCNGCRHFLPLTKAPQSWCYIEVEN